MAQWYEGSDMPGWSKGFPGIHEMRRGPFGWVVDVWENPWRASITVWKNRSDWFAQDESKVLWDYDDVRRISSWKQWHKRKQVMDAKLRKALEKVAKANKPRQASAGEHEATHPLLMGFLTSTDGVEKGTVREPGGLYLYCRDGTWKGVLSEKNPEASLWGSGNTFQELLNDLERALGSDDPDWRVPTARGQYTTSKKGKNGRA